MSHVLITTVAILVPCVTVVLIARAYFAYRQRRVEAPAELAASYRDLAQQATQAQTAMTGALTSIEERLRAVEALLRSVD